MKYHLVLRITMHVAGVLVPVLYLLDMASVVSPQSRGTANSGLEMSSEPPLQLPFGKQQDQFLSKRAPGNFVLLFCLLSRS
jgi:hypothetical protein